MSTITATRTSTGNDTAATPLAFAGPTAGFPTDINPAADLGSKKKATIDPVFIDSIYVTAQVTAPEHEFAFLVHLVRVDPAEIVRVTVSVTDKVTGWHQSHAAVTPAAAYSWAEGRLDLHAPGFSWTGDDQHQHLTTTTPWGAVDVDLDVAGPVLYYGGTGSWAMLGQRQHQYAFPQITATGTLTLDGVEHPVSGDAWLDRQWGPTPDLRSHHWSWMNLVLPDGDKLAVWDIRALSGAAAGTGQSWAHLLHADGSSELAAMVPLAEDADGYWTSPESGNVYPTRFVVRVPSFDAVLDVTAVTQAQELPGLQGNALYEGVARCVGTFRGQEVRSDLYIEHVGNHHA